MNVIPVLEIVPPVSHRLFVLFVMLTLGFSILLVSLPVLTDIGWKMGLSAHLVIPNVLSARILQQIVRHVLCQEQTSATSTIQPAFPRAPTRLSLQALPTFVPTATPSAWSALERWIVSAANALPQVLMRPFSSIIPLA